MPHLDLRFLRAVLSAQEAFHSLFLLFIRRGSTCQHSLEDLIFFIPASVICGENFVHKIHPVIPACRLQKVPHIFRKYSVNDCELLLQGDRRIHEQIRELRNSL